MKKDYEKDHVNESVRDSIVKILKSEKFEGFDTSH